MRAGRPRSAIAPASTPRARRAIPMICHSRSRSGNRRSAARTPMAKRGETRTCWIRASATSIGSLVSVARAPASAMANSRSASPAPFASVAAPIRSGPISSTTGPTCSPAKRTLKMPIDSAAMPTSQKRRARDDGARPEIGRMASNPRSTMPAVTPSSDTNSAASSRVAAASLATGLTVHRIDLTTCLRAAASGPPGRG